MKPSARAKHLQDQLQTKLKAHKKALAALPPPAHPAPAPTLINDTFFINHARYIESCEIKAEWANAST